VPALGTTDLARLAAPAAWYITVTQGRMDKFMPPFTSLSDAERWNVVAYALSLSAPTDEIATGKALYEENCTNCHGADGAKVAKANFADQQFMASRSASDLSQATAQGNGQDMPGFSGKLSEDDLWALAAFVRTISFQASEVAAISTPPPSATATTAETGLPSGTPAEALPTAGPGTVQPTAAITLEATSPPTAQASSTTQGLGTITGKVSHGAGGTVPAGLTATLHGVEHGQSTTATPTEVLTLTAPVDANGSFTFNKVEMPTNRLFYTSVDYGGTTFDSTFQVVTDGVTSLDLPITIYESTTDTSGLSISQSHILFDLTTPGSTVQVEEIVIVSNSGDKVVMMPKGGPPPVQIILPASATNLLFDDGSTLANSSRYVATSNGFGDTSSILPGDSQNQIIYIFDIPYNRNIDFSQAYTLPVASGSVLVPEGVQVSGDGLTPGTSRTLQGVVLTSSVFQNLPAGQALAFTVSGQPKTSTATGSDTASRNGLLIGIGALGIALLGVGAWLFLRQRRAEKELEAELEGIPAIQNDDDVLDAIIALDDQYRAGNIPEEAYRQRRQELKDQLKK
jgi:mono/diheme cytochrome c family protein